MNRTMKVLIAFSLFFVGCYITMHPEEPSLDSWLNPVVQMAGFVLMLSGGVYGFMKMIRPLIF